jgi:ribosome-associated protein
MQPRGDRPVSPHNRSSNNLLMQEPKKAAIKKRVSANPVRLLARHAVDAVLEKKARDVVVMDVQNVSGVADFFVVCTGDSELQIKAIAESIQDTIRETCDEKPWHTEGTDHREWVLIDYVDLVIHIFSPEKRAFYALERLWGDAPKEVVPDQGSGDEVQLLRENARDGSAE